MEEEGWDVRHGAEFFQARGEPGGFDVSCLVSSRKKQMKGKSWECTLITVVGHLALLPDKSESARIFGNIILVLRLAMCVHLCGIWWKLKFSRTSRLILHIICSSIFSHTSEIFVICWFLRCPVKAAIRVLQTSYKAGHSISLLYQITLKKS